MAKPNAATAKKLPAPAPASSPDPPLPAALAKRAKEAHANKLARLAAVGRGAIARIRERQADVAASMVDIGLALHELRAEGVAEALGRKGFAEVCEVDLELPLTTALNLIALATRVPRAVVTALGPERARAVLELVDATPANDTPEAVLAKPVKLPSGKLLDVRSAGVAEIREAAKAFRAARPGATTKRGRGFSASPEEKKTFAAFAKRLHEHHGEAAAQLIASRGAKGAKVRIEVHLSELTKLPTALRKALQG